MNLKWTNISFGVLMAVMFSSCGVNSNFMMRTHKDFQYADIDTLNTSKTNYRIDVNDIVQVRFFTNKGNKVLDISSAVQGGGFNQGQIFNANNALSYVIQNDSLVNLPVVLEVNLVGMTVREAEDYLAEKYAEFYVDPFVQITVTNRRVVVFPGNGGEAKVLYLQNNNTTLMEALALAGGITDRGRASSVKLFRKDENGKRLVYKIDLSKMQGLGYTDIIVQANDYIYVEPVAQIANEVLAEITPIVALLTSAALVITLFAIN